MTGALRVPLAVKLLMGIGLLFALNELAPGVAPTVLVLVGMYLVLSRTTVITTLIQSSNRSFQAALGGPNAFDKAHHPGSK